MDRLASITAFVRVAENGGFLGAARGLNVATTVSDQVRALEDALGARPRLGYCTAVAMLP
jgi:DNA-binding transcriptional LysR family regulator